MKDVVSSYRAYNREIINYVLNGVPSDKICSEIKVTTLKGLASRDVKKVIKTININIKKHDKNDTKSYYDIISYYENNQSPANYSYNPFYLPY